MEQAVPGSAREALIKALDSVSRPNRCAILGHIDDDARIGFEGGDSQIARVMVDMIDQRGLAFRLPTAIRLVLGEDAPALKASEVYELARQDCAAYGPPAKKAHHEDTKGK